MIKQETRLLTVPELVDSLGAAVASSSGLEGTGYMHNWELLRGGSHHGVAMLLFFGGEGWDWEQQSPPSSYDKGAKD